MGNAETIDQQILMHNRVWDFLVKFLHLALEVVFLIFSISQWLRLTYMSSKVSPFSV